MNRRGFLSSLAAIAATATLDPEKLLWVPGRKLISIPAPAAIKAFTFEITLDELSVRYIQPCVEILGQMAKEWLREWDRDNQALIGTGWAIMSQPPPPAAALGIEKL